MSSSGESLAVGRPHRVSLVWKIVAAVVLAIVAVPVMALTAMWAVAQFGDSNPATPVQVTTSTTMRR